MITLLCPPQNCPRSMFCCTPQQFAWLIAGNFENKTFLKESWQALKYLFCYIIGHERSLYGAIILFGEKKLGKDIMAFVHSSILVT